MWSSMSVIHQLYSKSSDCGNLYVLHVTRLFFYCSSIKCKFNNQFCLFLFLYPEPLHLDLPTNLQIIKPSLNLAGYKNQCWGWCMHYLWTTFLFQSSRSSACSSCKQDWFAIQLVNVQRVSIASFHNWFVWIFFSHCFMY